VASPCALAGERTLTQDDRKNLIRECEVMAGHIGECADLFEQMGRIPPEDQHELLQRLRAWRREAPRWSDYAASRSARRERS
jgi:hypothetical protein